MQAQKDVGWLKKEIKVNAKTLLAKQAKTNKDRRKIIKRTTLLLAFSVCNSNYELQH
jgi:hypothetical protein